MKHPVTIGVIMLARNTFDFEAARGLYADIKKNLAAIPDATFVCADDLVFEVPDLDEPIDKINKANVDGIAIISGTFHLGHLALEIAKRTNAPLLLWGLPELPYNGGKIRLNSVCGVNLNASNLYKAGRDDFHYCVSNDIDMDWVDAVRIRAKLKNAKIGILGFRAHGFFNLAFDELTLYKEIGVLIDHYELTDIWNQPVDEAAVEARKKQIAGIFDLSGVSGEQVQKVAELCERFKAFMDRQGLAGLAVRCWPEFAAGYGVSPCAAMSILQSEGYVIGCEGDVQGVVSQLMHTAMGVEQPFLADLSQVNFDTDSALMWHCGVAPCGLWDQCCVRSLDTYYAGGRGVTADFVLKSGKINVLRMDFARGKSRLFIECGDAISVPKELKGTYVKVVFDKPMREVLDTVVRNGIAHHVSLAYGENVRPLEIYARMNGMDVIR